VDRILAFGCTVFAQALTNRLLRSISAYDFNLAPISSLLRHHRARPLISGAPKPAAGILSRRTGHRAGQTSFTPGCNAGFRNESRGLSAASVARESPRTSWERVDGGVDFLGGEFLIERQAHLGNQLGGILADDAARQSSPCFLP